MDAWIPIVSLAMGSLAAAIWIFGHKYYVRRKARDHIWWQEEIRVKMARYNNAWLELTECEMDLENLARQCPEGYSRVIWRGVEMAQSIPPLILAKAEQLGLFESGALRDGALRPMPPSIDQTDPPAVPASPVRWIGKHPVRGRAS